MAFRFFKSTIFQFLLLTLSVILIQLIILKPHLRYAFADVDWSFLVSFKEISSLYSNPVSHLLAAWKIWGVYTYQVYYIGLIEKFFGMDYVNFQIVTHIFKIIATLSIYPVILVATKSRLAAFLTTLIYSFAYSSVGVMYTVVTSGLFVAIPFMFLFFFWHWKIINQKENSIKSNIVALILFLIALLLATERMYPLVPVLFLLELFWWYRNSFSKVSLLRIVKRISLFLLIFISLFLFKPEAFTAFTGNTHDTYVRFMAGNWQVIMSPFISFGSLFLPRDYWKYLGQPNVESIIWYIEYFITVPFVYFSIITAFLSIFLSKKKGRFIFNILSLSFAFSIVVYFLSSHQIHIPESVRIHFDIGTVVPALIGFYVIALMMNMFKEWEYDDKKDKLSITMIGALVAAFIFIALTWIAADWVLVFTGVHRYLTIPAIGSSFFIAGIITIIFKKLNTNRKTSGLSYFILLLLIPLFLFNTGVIEKYFDYELKYAGTDAEGHIRMKNKLRSYLPNLSNTEPSIFYFDESQDHDNGYFDETTIMAGFNYWMRFRGDKIVDSKAIPAILRSNLICKVERSMCLDAVKVLVKTKDGIVGIEYGGVFYKPENFYAFRFINKDLVDIRNEIAEAIGVN